MIGIGRQQGFYDHFLCCLVHFGDEVIRLLLGNAYRFDIKRGAVDEGTGGTGGFDSHVDHGVQIE